MKVVDVKAIARREDEGRFRVVLVFIIFYKICYTFRHLELAQGLETGVCMRGGSRRTLSRA